MVYTDIHLRSVSSKPRPDEPKEPKKWVEIHVLWIRFAMFFWGGTPKKLGEIKKSHEEHSMFFLFTKNWNREMMCCFLFVCVIDCAWIIFFWLGEVVRRPTKFPFHFDRWQLAAVVTWLTSFNSKWTIQKLYFMLGVKLKHLCSSSLGEV